MSEKEEGQKKRLERTWQKLLGATGWRNSHLMLFALEREHDLLSTVFFY